MNPLNTEPYQIAKRIGDGRHPYLGDDGVFLPDGTPLLRRSRTGDWELRPLPALAKALASHGDDIDLMVWRCRSLAGIADALNKGNKADAIFRLLHLRLRGDEAVTIRATAAPLNRRDRIALGKSCEDEPRIPAGNRTGGEWCNANWDGTSGYYGDNTRTDIIKNRIDDALQGKKFIAVIGGLGPVDKGR